MALKDRVIHSNQALNQRILVPLNVVSVLSLSVLGVVVMKGSTSVLRETMDSKIELAANFLEQAAKPYLANKDLAALESFVREVERDSDVAYVGFSDLQQKSLTRGAKGMPQDGRQVRVLQREVRDRDGKLLGYAKLAYLNHRVDDAVQSILLVVVLAIVFVQLVLTLALRTVTTSLSLAMKGIVERLTEASSAVFNSAREMSASSESLSNGVSKQGAALQETVASMAEMSSMLAQTATNARNCYSLTGKAAEKTKTGTRTMEQLVSAMGSIEAGNSQLTNMVNIIREISSKTNVINEIVFKTQLLSLNASIEAARAGQHGRGFAVVAEEVGSLAQLSGNAAKEISALLDSSLREVHQIVKSTEERVREGKGVSDSALRAFNEIANDIASISAQIQSINEAAKEQELGVRQSANALIQVDETTHSNSNVARQVLASAMLLGEQSKRITESMRAVRALILGAKADQDDRDTKRGGETQTPAPRLVTAVPSEAFPRGSVVQPGADLASLQTSSPPASTLKAASAVPPAPPMPGPVSSEALVMLESVVTPGKSGAVAANAVELAQRIARKSLDLSTPVTSVASEISGSSVAPAVLPLPPVSEDPLADISADDDSFRPAKAPNRKT